MHFPLVVLVGVLTGASFLAPAPATVAAHAVSPDPRHSAVVRDLDACPVSGAARYVDGWGDARSAGRRHEGVDMEASRGTPVLAVRDGDAEFKRSNLGGNAIWLTAQSGERFYYAHLDDWEGESRPVVAGEVIGYVGQTGNAQGDHLHFETRAGEAAVNPYPFVEQACTSTVEPRRPSVAAGLLLR